MRMVEIGRSGLRSSTLGLGCMGMSEFYGATDEEESLRTLGRAFEIGVRMFDTADIYGRGRNEELLARFLKGRRDTVVLASKFGIRRDPNGAPGSTHDRDLDNSAGYMRACCEASLRRLRTDRIDVYYVHRLDPRREVEEVVGDLAALVREGKIRAIGLSEVSADILRRAHAVHRVAAVQSEYSLFSRRVEKDVLPTCRELGVSLVAYSPLGRGILTGTLTDTSQLDATDLRRSVPRFSQENLSRNLELLSEVKRVAQAHSSTPSQVALAWLLAQGDEVIPIPGTKRIRFLEENVAATALRLDASELERIGESVARDRIAGARGYFDKPVPAETTRGAT
jgi:aryl-alcohol dehydrogenase-like predicted oxidoreductase